MLRGADEGCRSKKTEEREKAELLEGGGKTSPYDVSNILQMQDAAADAKAGAAAVVEKTDKAMQRGFSELISVIGEEPRLSAALRESRISR